MIHLCPGICKNCRQNLCVAILLLVTISQSVDAQILTGKILDKSGKPVEYATLFVRELRQGTTSNSAGDYKIQLPSGDYTILCQSLGYEPVILNVSLRADTVRNDVVLTEQLYQIEEVRITAQGEDPAYPIMRRAIGLAPYYLNNISHYRADVYLKGALEIKKIPGIVKKSLKIEAAKSSGSKGKSTVMKEGDSYLMESFNEIEFTAPDKYVQKVISFNSTFPEQGNEISPMDFIKASFYQPVIADMAVSPLSPSAFSYYNFKYLGASPQGNFTISKIEVIPKRKSQQVFEGTIYIIDDLWCLQSVDLTNNNFAGTIRVKQLYIPVENDIWMPVSHNFDINIGIMGFRADAGYGSSVKYLEVLPNNQLKKPDPLTGTYSGSYSVSDTGMTKTRQQIEKILQKDELSNRDMVRLSNLMEKESRDSKGDSARKSLEIKETTKYIVEKDAAGKDSSYWAGIRPIPLSVSELRSIRVRDSLNLALSGKAVTGKDTIAAAKRKSSFIKCLKNMASGHTWSDTTGLNFTFGGLLNLKSLKFNTVDGFVYGTDFRISARFSNHRYLGFYPEVRYAFSREKLLWRANLNYSPGGVNPSQIFIRAGMTSKDINSEGGINPLLNSLSSLLMRRNYLKLYESRFITMGYRFEIINGLKTELNAGFEARRVLHNTTEFSIFRPALKYTENVPVNDYLEPGSNTSNFLNDQKHFEIEADVTFTPFQKYRINNGRKSEEGSDWPDFRFTWDHGINEVSSPGEGFRHYDRLMLGISQKRETGAFSSIRWNIRTGGFIDNRELSYFDFFHFNSQPILVLLDDYNDAFMQPGFYSLSTPEFFGEAHFRYTTPYLLLKLLPGLSNTLIRENLSVSYIVSHHRSNYTELGYALSEIFLFAEAGVYAGFDDLKFRSFGAKIVFRFN